VPKALQMIVRQRSHRVEQQGAGTEFHQRPGRPFPQEVIDDR